MATPQELYAKKLDEIVKRFDNLNNDTIRRTIGLLQDMRGRLFAELAQGGSEFNEFRLRQMTRQVDSLVADFQQQLGGVVRNSITQAHEIGGAAMVEPLVAGSIDGVFFSPSPAQLNAVLDFSADLVQDIGRDMRQKINTQLRLAALGERTPFAAMRGITQALGVKAKDGVWGTRRRPEVVRGVAARAETILRTEMARVYNLANFSQMEANKKQVPGLKKRWIATLGDRRTRPAHLQAHAETADKPIPVSQAFDVGGDKLRFPGDPLGPPGQTINCRCRPQAVLPETQ